MVCPICITTFLAANAPVIISTGVAMGGIAAVKLGHVPEKRKMDDTTNNTKNALSKTRVDYRKMNNMDDE
jgi:hypothetical protein